MAADVLANQQTILANQEKILANQTKILANQALAWSKLPRRTRRRSSRTSDKILTNQKTILSNQDKLDRVPAAEPGEDPGQPGQDPQEVMRSGRSVETAHDGGVALTEQPQRVHDGWHGACRPHRLCRGSSRWALLAAAGFGAPRRVPAKAGTPTDPGTIRVAYLGLTCEAPIFVAREKGLFAEQGSRRRTRPDGLGRVPRGGLASGQFQANHTLLMYALTGIEKGCDFRITAGVHTGCLRVQVSANSPIKTVAELKGKRIGVPTNMGSPPAMFASRALAAAGIDPSLGAEEVTWIATEPGLLGSAG